ncbi:hypothetical protein F6X14_22105 [Salmonella enterica]|nr:hypothetical protein [Salmonella enterica subsp. enterica]EAN8310169.1 hypothetical protein [Salmonella enterica]EBF8307512.1 hypothetical protein [Salmonella enterica subsp. enterica serovar Ealing]EBL5975839.1 hypothetical protein [Salmonella enterica subsp. enterica serovar Montevideo]EBR0227217.1 hypothetical protein [Salmonella enterica subsp. enterica serovar Monschaui]EBS5062001.1 hypothetical protein [Salmonella enterica subsp. enterica serovar Anecho]ECB1672240.1 hypothetical prot
MKFVNIYNFLILFGRSDRLRIVCYREFLVGRAIRRLGTGSDEVSTRSQKSKNPDNLYVWRRRRLPGPHQNCIAINQTMQGV